MKRRERFKTTTKHNTIETISISYTQSNNGVGSTWKFLSCKNIATTVYSAWCVVIHEKQKRHKSVFMEITVLDDNHLTFIQTCISNTSTISHCPNFQHHEDDLCRAQPIYYHKSKIIYWILTDRNLGWSMHSMRLSGHDSCFKRAAQLYSRKRYQFSIEKNK